jgi:hypothetical protein
MVYRWKAGSLPIASAPRTALATARSTSAAVPRGTVSITDWSKGFKTGMVSALSTQLPLMYIFIASDSYLK